ncbi:MAG: hypothetical protein GF331_08210 [Chitinivibrionales bacterium]|nr:hypothetical protein [Chitinivibrionales bacterium]
MSFLLAYESCAEECARLESDLLSAGYSVFNRRDVFVQYRGSTPGMRDVDLLIADTATMARLRSQGTEVSMAGRTFTVPSIMHLIAMKLHPIAGNPKRELKHFPDIVHLVRESHLDPNAEEVVTLFRDYGTGELHARLVELLGRDT